MGAKLDLGNAPQKVRDVFDNLYFDGGVEDAYVEAMQKFQTDDLVILTDRTKKIIILPRFDFLARLHLEPNQDLAKFLRQKVTQSVRNKTGVPGFWLVVRGTETHVVSIKVSFSENEQGTGK